MKELGVFVYDREFGGSVKVRIPINDEYYFDLPFYEKKYGWLSYHKHQKIAPIDLGVWNDDVRD